MRHSTHRIRSTHGGNLPRPAAFDALLRQGPIVTAEVAAELPGAVRYVVDRQLECGVDVLNDGEYVKAAGGGATPGTSTSGCPGGRCCRSTRPGPARGRASASGSGGCSPDSTNPGCGCRGRAARCGRDISRRAARRSRTTERVATGPVTYTGHDAIKADTDALTKALSGKPAETEGFVAALGPLSLGAGARNEYYSSEEEYMTAVAEVVREEYKAITDAGFIVQIDEPEFATSWQFYPDWTCRGLPPLPGVLRRDHQSRAAMACPRTRSGSTSAGAAATGRTSRTSTWSHRRPAAEDQRPGVLRRGRQRQARARVAACGATSSCPTARYWCPA